MWFIGVEVEQETNKKNPGSAPAIDLNCVFHLMSRWPRYSVQGERIFCQFGFFWQIEPTIIYWTPTWTTFRVRIDFIHETRQRCRLQK